MRLSKLNLARMAFVLLLLVTLVLVVLNPGITAFVVVGVAAVALFFDVRCHARVTVYTCPECDHRFRISPWTDFVSPHTGDKKWLTCPSCSKQLWSKMS